MKSNISRLFLIAAGAFAMASCSENSWNNDLDGFEPGADMSDVQTVAVTMNANDYNRLANNRFNVALAKEQGVSSALKAVATNQYLTSEIPAADYIPNLLNDSLFSYFSLSNGSAINLTYRQVKAELPELMKNLTDCRMYTVSDADYQDVYGSDEDYAASFSPGHAPGANVPRLLKTAFPDAKAGEYCVVSYNYSDTDPAFEQEAFEYTSLIDNNLKDGDVVALKAQVTAICTAGMIVSDDAGSILVYGKGFSADNYKIGDNLDINATIGAYRNCMQIDFTKSDIKVVSNSKVKYPTPVAIDAARIKAAGANADPVVAVYGVMTGTVLVDGKYINITLDGTTTERGSIYNATDAQKEMLKDGEKVSILGYFTQTSVSKGVTNANFVVVNVESAAKAARRGAPLRVVALPSTGVNAAYTFDGSAWSAVDDSQLTILQPADYTAMGQKYGNLEGDLPAQLLPIYLKRSFPYTVADDVKFVAYKYYSNKQTKYACSQWTFNGTDWVDTVAADGVETVTNQFVKRDGKWQMDPSIEITLPAGRGQAYSATFYQACVDWVKNNVPDGSAYITSYGNNDYYTGCSAYQNNIDLRASAAKDQYAGYKDMSDEEVVALMKERFETQVCPGVLKEWYPNIAPVGDFQPTVTIHFYTYNGSTTDPQTIVYKVIGKADFEFVSCTWND